MAKSEGALRRSLGPATSSDAALDAAVRSEQARKISDGLPRTLAGHAISSVVVGLLMLQQLPFEMVAAWFGVVCVVLAVRLWAVRRPSILAAIEADPDRVLRLTTIGGVVGGVVWGVVPFVVTKADSFASDSFAIFMLNGVTAGAVVMATAHAATGLAFATVVLGALMGALLARGGLPHLGFAGCVGIFLLMLAKSATAAEATFREAMRLKHEKGRLADSLADARDRAQSAIDDLEHQALVDALTGLSNRNAFNLQLSRELAQALADGQSVAVLLIDVDHFKMINDTLGHGAGDDLLVEFGRRLRRTVREADVVARLGGDEFAIMVSGGDLDRLVPDLANRLLDVIAAPVEIASRSTQVGASIGVAVFPRDARAHDDLLACADMALYQSKDMGRRRWSAFDPVLALRARTRRELELDLREAIAADRLEFHFQPQVSIRDGQVVGFETLLRWNHPERGWVPPPAVIAAAHAEHLAASVTRKALESAADLLEWLAANGHASIRVAVNISPRDLSSYAFSDLVEEVITGRQFAPGRLEIEITEDVMLDPATSGRQFAHLDRLGIALAVDDFGVGYSSLAYLRDLNIASVKIDRRFVTNIVLDEGDRVLVQAIRSVGDSLGIQLVAEGVETQEQLAMLRQLGCDIAQGFLFAPALPREAALDWLGSYVASHRGQRRGEPGRPADA
ncbi:putative bifunctional diguanylate cyclase/phosphodiesterase [Methylobrevis albus]|uniref:EAL domain-containing protein n=1 Tax=Methylobrevis albus TaxID=2793297 RepID=A0A931I426_9HYPH|nr:EAL domain-containing protein [Methylobrevis albus]MBH0239865.1 EAL domain-containing protein [Methylobrevis albus]